jgi:FkbM family methyltransferase
MKRLFNSGVPRDIPWTWGGSVSAWTLNCLRVPRPVERLLAGRFIENITEAGDNMLSLQIKGYEGKLYFSKEVTTTSLYQTLVEQLYSWHWHYYQVPQTRVRADDIVLDCGSAEGIFPFLNRRSARRIYAFEPLPAFIKGLQRTFGDDPAVIVVPAALAETPGTAYLHEAGLNSSLTSTPGGPAVKVDSVDHYCEEHKIEISYLKADLEGYEMHALRGAAESIRVCKPRIAITTYHRKEHAREISDWLKSLNPGYRFLLKGICRLNANPIMLHAW